MRGAPYMLPGHKLFTRTDIISETNLIILWQITNTADGCGEFVTTAFRMEHEGGYAEKADLRFCRNLAFIKMKLLRKEEELFNLISQE